MALNIEFNGQSKRVRVTPGTTMVALAVGVYAQPCCVRFVPNLLLCVCVLFCLDVQISFKFSKTRAVNSSLQSRCSTSFCTATVPWTCRSHSD